MIMIYEYWGNILEKWVFFFRKSEESYKDEQENLKKKMRKFMKINEENLRESEESYEDKWRKLWENLRKFRKSEES